MIEMLLPRASDAELDERLTRLRAAPSRAPFDAIGMAFVETVSRALLGDRTFGSTGALVALGHWFRHANLRALHAHLTSRGSVGANLGVRRGVVFHLAPANVDTLPLYCWLLSLLCGNANILRVSRRSVADLGAFFERVASILAREDFSLLAESNLVLTYDHDEAMTEHLSARCDLRLVWGSDARVSQLRRVPLPPLAGELVFPNRFSIAMIRAAALEGLSEPRLRVLAEGFRRDVFEFDQQACASPRALVWVGDEASCQRARARFWPAVAAELAERGLEQDAMQVMDRLTTQFRLLESRPGARAETPPGVLPARVWLTDLGLEERQIHAGQGVLIELERASLREALRLLQPCDQTIGYFGFAREDWLEHLPELPTHAGDRLVPIGSALTFSPVWDGVDLLHAFTRTPFLV